MVIEPEGDGWKVAGRPSDAGDEAQPSGSKRDREEEKNGQNKRVKLDEEHKTDSHTSHSPSSKAISTADLPDQKEDTIKIEASSLESTRPRGKGDVFLAEDIRERLSATLDVSSSSYPLCQR
jgi:hypothetical protein